MIASAARIFRRCIMASSQSTGRSPTLLAGESTTAVHRRGQKAHRHRQHRRQTSALQNNRGTRLATEFAATVSDDDNRAARQVSVHRRRDRRAVRLGCHPRNSSSLVCRAMTCACRASSSAKPGTRVSGTQICERRRPWARSLSSAPMVREVEQPEIVPVCGINIETLRTCCRADRYCTPSTIQTCPELGERRCWWPM